MNSVRDESVLVWRDYEKTATLQTTSRRLRISLEAAGVHGEEVDGIWVFRFPKAWFRLATPHGMIRLGWYPSRRERGCLVLFDETRPKLRVLRPGQAAEA